MQSAGSPSSRALRRGAAALSGGIAVLLCFSLLLSVLIPYPFSASLAAEEPSAAAVAAAPEYLCPGGMPFGIRFSMDGILVAGVTEVICGGGRRSPARDAGIREKDMITGADGRALHSVEELSGILESSGGAPITLQILREGKEKTLTLTPVPADPDGIYRAGMWIRDSTAGIGTVTFIDPANGNFAGLGHGICDSDTGMLLPLREGGVTGVKLRGIKKGTPGNPGELQGYFDGGDYGLLRANALTGVYGRLTKEALRALIEGGLRKDDPAHALLPVAKEKDLHTGKAAILCTLGDLGVCAYEIEIEKIEGTRTPCKNFTLHVTDRALLDAAGGIVQGMSGSPIIQDGKLAGAVTHVRISDPTRGYGIFIGNMLENAP